MESRKQCEDRIKMVKCMEYICRQINNEDILEAWLMSGVADGDIAYGDLSVPEMSDESVETNDEAFWYVIDDENFAELMACFLRRMVRAEKSGGLYCGGVLSK